MPKPKQGSPSYLFRAGNGRDELEVTLPGTTQRLSVFCDWWGTRKKKFQLVITDTDADDLAVCLRFDDQGNLQDIVVAREHMEKITSDDNPRQTA